MPLNIPAQSNNAGFEATNAVMRIDQIIIVPPMSMIVTARTYKDATQTVAIAEFTFPIPYDPTTPDPVQQAQQWLIDENEFPGADII